jgi:hypothetical protein
VALLHPVMMIRDTLKPRYKLKDTISRMLLILFNKKDELFLLIRMTFLLLFWLLNQPRFLPFSLDFIFPL